MVRFAKKKLDMNSTLLYADISNEKHRVFVRIAKLYYGIEQYRFASTTFVENVQVTGFLCPKLKITWFALSIYNKVLQLARNIPLTARLNYYDAYKLRKILKSEFNLLIFTRESTSTNFQLLPLEETRWEQINLCQQRIQRTLDNPPAYV